MFLSDLATGNTGVITRVKGNGAFRKRIAEMGFVKGKIIKVIRNAPLQDPVQYSILGYEVSLRRSEASLIEVSPTPLKEEKNRLIAKLESTGAGPVHQDKKISIALVGNPNCGKTSIFNSYTRSSEHVGNYGGVTVDIKLSQIEYNGY
jgi:ferrous iron transport protein B